LAAKAVLTGFGRHHQQHEAAPEELHAGAPEEQYRSKIGTSAL
jgi:hypothetical protein